VSTTALLPPPREPTRHDALDTLADHVLQAANLGDLSQLLTRALPEILSLEQATLLLWDRKLESFHVLAPGDSGVRTLSPGTRVAAPEARFLLADGYLMETAGRDPGVLLPLMARSGLVGMLVLGAPAPPRPAPLEEAEVPAVAALASRAALAIENHLYQAELIASERMAALGTMAGMLAHDFRGPLTVIRGYAEMLAGPAATPEEVRQRAGFIVDAVDRLERMTAETLDFAREGGRLVRRSVVLSRFLEDLAEDVGREFPGLTVRRHFTLAPQAAASLDADKILRVVGNIAANALDAMGGQGVFHIQASVEPGPAGPLLRIGLADEGPGVPPDIRESLFQPFVTRGKKRGTGLGLAVARRFVEDHGGLIELEEGGPGARFRILLPIQDAAAS
jgi:signal transduction histidine kinase